MQIIENKALLLKVKEPGRITTVIPRSKELANGTVLVKWGLEEAKFSRTSASRMSPHLSLLTINGPVYTSRSLTRKQLLSS